MSRSTRESVKVLPWLLAGLALAGCDPLERDGRIERNDLDQSVSDMLSNLKSKIPTKLPSIHRSTASSGEDGEAAPADARTPCSKRQHAVSAIRCEGETFEEAYASGKAATEVWPGQRPPVSTEQVPESPTDAYSLRVNYSDFIASDVSAAHTATELNTQFNFIRDNRFMPDPEITGFLRRPSWLYPDDGCWARAQLATARAASILFGSYYADQPSALGSRALGKLFVFGDLHVKTDNSPTGEVLWWYHVAPTTRVNGEVFVLDPALSPKAPLKVADWVTLVSPDPKQAQLSACDAAAYTPYSDCRGSVDVDLKTAQGDQAYYLSLERQRQKDLGRDPAKVLGDLPPWAPPPAPPVPPPAPKKPFYCKIPLFGRLFKVCRK